MIQITKIEKVEQGNSDVKTISSEFYHSKDFSFYIGKIKKNDLMIFNGLVVEHKDTKDYITIPIEILKELFDLNDRDTTN
ncbi:MAG: hypothetical protein M0R17_04525 [Candidatus Omnitrophica bacterium]|jgi:hypothetical protein|nr:hypothetical protein [Candidatus Omnitrophota bacterium]